VTARPLIAALVCLSLSGCATGGNAHWWSPGTWFSAREADKVDNAAAVQDKAREAAIKAAQRATHETAEALAAAPESRPVEVATESNASALGLLDQAAGPMTAAELSAVRKQVAGLLSDNAALRADAEKARAKLRTADEKLSERLAAADATLAAAQAKLRDAFDRENALANQLRNQRAIAWIVGGVALIAAAGWVYLQVTVGGLPSALGAARRALEAKSPELAAAVAPFYSAALNRSEKARIRRATVLP
jgi:regulator of replication initiation timing